MRSNFLTSRELVRGVASRADRLFIVTKGKSLMAEAIAHSSMLVLADGKWGDGVDTDWDSTAIAVAQKPARKVLMIGEDGDIAVYLGGGKSEGEKITPQPMAIRNAKTINGYVYACGMKRQVFRRGGEGVWTDISAPSAGPTDSAGFEAIDGYSEKEIYGVGWNGEIWQYRWQGMDPARKPDESDLHRRLLRERRQRLYRWTERPHVPRPKRRLGTDRVR